MEEQSKLALARALREKNEAAAAAASRAHAHLDACECRCVYRIAPLSRSLVDTKPTSSLASG